MTRPAVVRCIAAAAGLVLAAGVTTVVLEREQEAASAAPLGASAPVLVEPAAEAATARPKAAKDKAEQTGKPYVDPLLGPPPGPQVDAVPERTAAPADRYAFLVGVTSYPSPTVDTIGGANDVQLIRASLIEAGWLPDHVRVLTDAQVTGRAVRDGLAWLADRGVAGTFTMFHYSGHVQRLGGGTEALWPVDRDFVRDRELRAALAPVRGHLWVDIAGCEAGSFLPGLPSDRVLVSVSSGATEKSYEYPKWGRSVWTGLVYDLGTGQRQADADEDGRVTMGEALRYSTYYAQLITRDQQPHGRQTPEVKGDPVLGWTLDAPPA